MIPKSLVPCALFSLACALFSLAACGDGSTLPVGEVYETVSGDQRLVVQTTSEVDYFQGGDTIYSGTYLIQEDGRVRLAFTAFGTAVTAYMDVTDEGLQEVEADGTLGQVLYDRAHIDEAREAASCAVLEEEVERLTEWQENRAPRRGYAVDAERARDSQREVEWMLTGVESQYYVVHARHDGCSRVYAFSSSDPEGGQFLDSDDAERQWEEQLASTERDREVEAEARAREAEAARVAAAERARLRRELVARSAARTRSYGTFTVFTPEELFPRRASRRATVEVTDVALTGLKPQQRDYLDIELTGDPADVLWYCRLSRIENLGPARLGYPVRFNNGSFGPPGYFYLDSQGEQDEFVATLTRARDAWLTEFDTVRTDFRCEVE